MRSAFLFQKRVLSEKHFNEPSKCRGAGRLTRTTRDPASVSLWLAFLSAQRNAGLVSADMHEASHIGGHLLSFLLRVRGAKRLFEVISNG